MPNAYSAPCRKRFGDRAAWRFEYVPVGLHLRWGGSYLMRGIFSIRNEEVKYKGEGGSKKRSQNTLLVIPTDPREGGGSGGISPDQTCKISTARSLGFARNDNPF